MKKAFILSIFVVFFFSCESKYDKQSKLNQEMNNKLEALNRMKQDAIIQLAEAKKADSLSNGESIENRKKIIFLEAKIKAIDVKYNNPRVTYDNKYWYISVGVEVDKKQEELTDISLGIDLGLKDLAVCSDGKVFKNINKHIHNYI